MSEKIAIVILNWNGKQLLEQFLPSVITHSQKASIYLADNASEDDSIAFVKTAYPSIKIIQNKKNGGYAKGYNEALKHVNEDLLCLLNSDIEVTKNWLSPILSVFNTEDNTAIIQPKILDYKDKSKFEYAGAAGGFIDKYGYPYCRGRVFNTIETDTGQYNDISKIFWASGACFFIRKSAFETLGGFDESFFAHMEEIDLCWRAFNLNFDIKYVGHSTIYHVGGATLNTNNPKKTYLNFRNSLFTITKNAKGNIFLIIVFRLLLDGLAAFKFLIAFKIMHFFAIFRAHLSYYTHLSQLLKKRKALNQSSKYYSIKSIVWSYYVDRRTHFKHL